MSLPHERAGAESSASESTDVVERGGASGVSGLEGVLSGVLAEVLQAERVPVDDNFFDDLGADSLVMARFCARVRKRGDLPAISMREIYAHPTIRSLAAALALAGQQHATETEAAPAEAPSPTKGSEHLLCGVLQALFYLAYSYLFVRAISNAYDWVAAGSTLLDMYLRMVSAAGALFLAMSLLPVAAKWALIGRWKPQSIRLWSLAYVRFWLVKTLERYSPAALLFNATPVYPLYLRALGAKIGKRVVIFSRVVPVCTDLLSIGDGTVIREEALFNGYRAQAGRIETGTVSIGRDVYVGQRSVLDINTALGDGAQLGHASALHSGQAVPAGERWHGSPAQRTEVNYLRVTPARCSAFRRVRYSVGAFLVMLLLYVPFMAVATDRVYTWTRALARLLYPDTGRWTDMLAQGGLVSIFLFFGLTLLGFVILITVPRALNLLLKPDKVYPLYGIHYMAYRAIARLTNSHFFTLLLGDSSYIVGYLRTIGYRLKPVVQTGSNFGTEVMQTNPLLCSVGSGTMVADGLMMMNDEVSNTSFRVSRANIGKLNFLGNFITFPTGARTGDNCLLASKVMVPIEGGIRKGIGLLGSPSFEIPRTVERDTKFDHLREGEALRRGLAKKNRYNLRTIGVFVFLRLLSVFIFSFPYLTTIDLYARLPREVDAAFFASSMVLTALYFALVLRLLFVFHPVKPTICSIYHADFWAVERFWKMHPIHSLHPFDGTPFKCVLWRIMGARIGKRVFDDGAHYPEPTLATVGDESVLNFRSAVQCHSQEDGTFKCDRTTVGAGCTIGTGALVHYGVTIGDGAVLAADSFLMKGEEVPPRARWGGNPARELR